MLTNWNAGSGADGIRSVLKTFSSDAVVMVTIKNYLEVTATQGEPFAPFFLSRKCDGVVCEQSMDTAPPVAIISG